jgi:hypothetical protein
LISPSRKDNVCVFDSRPHFAMCHANSSSTGRTRASLRGRTFSPSRHVRCRFLISGRTSCIPSRLQRFPSPPCVSSKLLRPWHASCNHRGCTVSPLLHVCNANSSFTGPLRATLVAASFSTQDVVQVQTHTKKYSLLSSIEIWISSRSHERGTRETVMRTRTMRYDKVMNGLNRCYFQR